MAYDIANSVERKMGKIRQWRGQYTAFDYPYKVTLNMFYELYTYSFMWDQLDKCFSINGGYEFKEAMELISKQKKIFQINEMRDRVLDLMDRDYPLGSEGMCYSNFRPTIESARNGSNEAIEEIEYSYVYYAALFELLIPWAACGLTGLNKHQAFVEVTGGDVGGLEMDAIDDAIKYLNTIANFELAESYQKMPDYH
jgi:hypothetical protein